jgi:hypothetical protein
MDPDKKPDDKKELTEEEILALIEELKKHKQNKHIAISLGRACCRYSSRHGTNDSAWFFHCHYTPDVSRKLCQNLII